MITCDRFKTKVFQIKKCQTLDAWGYTETCFSCTCCKSHLIQLERAIYTYVYNVYNVSFERITCFTFVNTVIRKHVGEFE